MFGYFKFYKQYSNKLVQNCYKNYYCGLCFALEKNYGELSRLLLSYDITLLAIVLNAHTDPTMDKLKCYGQDKYKRILFTDSDWKKIAGINILLASEKMEDDICDENSVKSRIARFVFRKAIKSAQHDYPDIYNTISEGYKKIQADETSNSSVQKLAEDFAALMIAVLTNYFEVNAWQIDYVSYISKWLYFIDALDDLEEDIKKNRFNPLRKYKSLDNIKNRHFQDVNSYLKLIRSESPLLFKGQGEQSYESIILDSFLYNTIPINTERVLNSE